MKTASVQHTGKKYYVVCLEDGVQISAIHTGYFTDVGRIIQDWLISGKAPDDKLSVK